MRGTMKNLCCIILLVFIVTTPTSSQNVECPFDYYYRLGDGFTDIGNAVRILPFGPSIPAARWPYGKSTGGPTGRWSDGYVDTDFAAPGLGFPRPVPFLAMNPYTDNAIVFSVAGSPVLDRQFYECRGVKIPPYAVSLRKQFKWFKKYLATVCSTPEEIATRLANSLHLMGDTLAHDIAYPLLQGKSIRDIQTTYIPRAVQTQIDVARELIKMGATRVAFPGNVPLGCSPYVLSAFRGRNGSAYDDLGCLRRVNDLVTFKNDYLAAAVNDLKNEYPNLSLFYADVFGTVQNLIKEQYASGNVALKACCGIGGKYNYDSRRFCGSPGVPVCSDPNRYIYWDGIYLTQEANRRLVDILIPPALPALNCTVTNSAIISALELPGVQPTLADI